MILQLCRACRASSIMSWQFILFLRPNFWILLLCFPIENCVYSCPCPLIGWKGFAFCPVRPILTLPFRRRPSHKSISPVHQHVHHTPLVLLLFVIVLCFFFTHCPLCFHKSFSCPFTDACVARVSRGWCSCSAVRPLPLRCRWCLLTLFLLFTSLCVFLSLTCFYYLSSLPVWRSILAVRTLIVVWFLRVPLHPR